MKSWREINALYQIYPRSYRDTNRDGVGDLPGITEKIEYLSDILGVDAIWLSPFYPSPQIDYGYDISDYCAVDPVFGTLDDFQNLLEEAHSNGIKVMIDLVPNHTSDQHAWFKESRGSNDNPKRDWYVWRDPKEDGSEPNNWLSVSGGKSWTFDETTGQYYLHTFMPEQPDLNWENPEVIEAIQNVMRFWFDKGVDGFRVDAIWGISKDESLADDPKNPGFEGSPDEFGYYIHKHCKQGPKTVERLRQLTDVAKEYDDRFLIFEYYPDDKLGEMLPQYKMIYGADASVSAPFFFEGFRLPWHAELFGTTFHEYCTMLEGGEIPVFGISNHDQPRIASRLSQEQARLMALMQLTLPGIPLVYYGDEIGMEDGNLSADELRDQFDALKGGMGGRDPERTPMQWDDSEYAGFGDVKPWLPIHANKETVNVARQLFDHDSLLMIHRALLAFRSMNDLMKYGSFETMFVGNGYVFAYKREYEGKRYYTALNFDNTPQFVTMPEMGKVVYATHPVDLPELADDRSITLRPYEGILVEATV